MIQSITNKQLPSGAHVQVVKFNKVIDSNESGLTIHTYVAGEDSFGTATHILETPGGLQIIDTQYLRKYAQEFRAYADSLNKGISLVIISHAHPDHYFGLEYFQDVTSLAFPEVINKIKEGGQHMINESKKGLGDAVTDNIFLPKASLSTKDIILDGLICKINKYENAESEVQTVVTLPQYKVIILQDLVANGYHPWLGKTIQGWINRLEVIARRYADYGHIFVGHGKPTQYEAYNQMIKYLTFAESILGPNMYERLVREYPNLKGRQLINMYTKYL